MYEFDAAGFRSLVGELETLMSAPDVSCRRLEYELFGILARLFEQGVTLARIGGYVSARPWLGMAWSDEFEAADPTYRAWIQRWQDGGTFGPERFGDADLVDLPLEPFNPRCTDASSRADSLSRALMQLMVGACMYDQGYEHEAVRDWLDRFIGWGNRVDRELRVLYLRMPWDYEWTRQEAEGRGSSEG